MCLCHVSIFFSVFMRTFTGCRNVSLSCEHFTLCSCKHLQVAEMCLCHVSILLCVHANIDRLQKCVSVM